MNEGLWKADPYISASQPLVYIQHSKDYILCLLHISFQFKETLPATQPACLPSNFRCTIISCILSLDIDKFDKFSWTKSKNTVCSCRKCHTSPLWSVNGTQITPAEKGTWIQLWNNSNESSFDINSFDFAFREYFCALIKPPRKHVTCYEWYCYWNL